MPSTRLEWGKLLPIHYLTKCVDKFLHILSFTDIIHPSQNAICKKICEDMRSIHKESRLRAHTWMVILEIPRNLCYFPQRSLNSSTHSHNMIIIEEYIYISHVYFL